MSYVKAMRSYFRDDENYIKWVESSNLALNQQVNRMELELQIAREEIKTLTDNLEDETVPNCTHIDWDEIIGREKAK